MVARVPTAGDLPGERLADMLVMEKHEEEKGKRFAVQSGERFISDRVNGSARRIVEMVSQGAHALVHCPLSDRDGRLDLLDWLKGRHAPVGRVWMQDAWLRTPRPGVSLRLTREQTEKAEQCASHPQKPSSTRAMSACRRLWSGVAADCKHVVYHRVERFPAPDALSDKLAHRTASQTDHIPVGNASVAR
jgi:hypothetical protein